MICRLVLRISEPIEKKCMLESNLLPKFLMIVLGMQLMDALLLKNGFELKIHSSIVLLKNKIWTDRIYLELALICGMIKSM